MLDVAEKILNKCTKLDPACDVYKDEFRVAFNYEFIEDAQTHVEDSENEEGSIAFTNTGASTSQSGGSANR